MILFQELICSWGKNLRSAGELRRNVPAADTFLSPSEAGTGEFAVAHHSVLFLGEEEFKPSKAKLTLYNDVVPLLFMSGGIQIHLHKSRPHCIAVKFKWTEEVGAPERPDRHLINLEKGQWVQVLYNGRSALSGTVHTDWRYSQWTTNVAFIEKFDEKIFSQEPIARISELADLR